MREFKFDETLLQRSEMAREKLIADEKTKKSQLVQWLQNAFGELLLRWVHLKAIRAFVESVLRYGLPPDFVAILMEPKKKNEKRLRQELRKLYGYLGGAGMSEKEDDATMMLGMGEAEFYPYVYLNLTLRKMQ